MIDCSEKRNGWLNLELKSLNDTVIKAYQKQINSLLKPRTLFDHLNDCFLQIPRCAPCPAGYSCANITQPPVPCSAGFYSLQGAASCTECEPGQACTDPAQSPKHCPSGTYSQKVKFCFCCWSINNNNNNTIIE